jgi:hypothetical protein
MATREMQVIPISSSAAGTVPAPAEAVAPGPAPLPLTLYALEEQLTILAETAEVVSEEQEQAFLADFKQAVTATVEKRDRVGQFMAHLEHQAAFAAAEMHRLQERKAFFERALDKIKQYVIFIIESMGPDGKGKFPKLEGKTVTFSIRDCPPSVEIRDEAAIPADYRLLTVTIPAPKWEALLDSLDLDQRAAVLDSVDKSKVSVSKTAVKKAIDGGRLVPGADLVVGKKTLIRK